jgi:hypothetical protein
MSSNGQEYPTAAQLHARGLGWLQTGAEAAGADRAGAACLAIGSFLGALSADTLAVRSPARHDAAPASPSAVVAYLEDLSGTASLSAGEDDAVTAVIGLLSEDQIARRA